MRFLKCSLLALLSTAPTDAGPILAPPSEGKHPPLDQSRHHGVQVQKSRIDARSRNIVVANEAAHSWDTKHICHPVEYWRLGPESAKEAHAKEFFRDWMKAYRSEVYSQQCDESRYTAIQCFASIFWGDFDFGCTIDQIERCAVPTACQITTWIQWQHPDWPASQVVDTARKVYYIYKHFQVVISDLKSDWDMIAHMGISVALETHHTVDAFTPQHDEVQLANCKMVQQMAEIVVDVLIQSAVVGLNAGMAVGKLRQFTQTADDLMTKAKNNPKDKTKMKEAVIAAEKVILIRNSVYYAQWLNGQVRKGRQGVQQVTDAHYSANGAGVPERGTEAPRLEFPFARSHGFCGNVFGVIDDNAGSQTDQMVKFVSEHVHQVRHTVEQLFNSFFIKDQEDLGDKALEDIMDFEEWPGRPTRSYEGIEERVKAAIRNTVLSELMAASRQYIKCEERDDAAELCKQDKELKPKKWQGIVCPPKYPKLRCKAGRWTKKQLFNSEKQVSGLEGGDKFAAYGIDFDDLVSNSVERFYTMGIDSYSPRALFAEGKIVDPAKMAHLPVAVSKVKTVHTGHTFLDFPFSCGDWTSDCTAAFLDRINVNITDEWELRTGPLADHLSQIPEPANRFLLMCALGVSWPNSYDTKHGLVNSEPSVICGKVRKAIEDKDEFEGNYRFCHLDMVQKHIFKHERLFILGSAQAHKKLCERWLFDNSMEIDKRRIELDHREGEQSETAKIEPPSSQ